MQAFNAGPLQLSVKHIVHATACSRIRQQTIGTLNTLQRNLARLTDAAQHQAMHDAATAQQQRVHHKGPHIDLQAGCLFVVHKRAREPEGGAAPGTIFLQVVAVLVFENGDFKPLTLPFPAFNDQTPRTGLGGLRHHDFDRLQHLHACDSLLGAAAKNGQHLAQSFVLLWRDFSALAMAGVVARVDRNAG